MFEFQSGKFYMPKDIAIVRILGNIELHIKENTGFIIPTEEQRKNLKEMLCIDVEVLNED